MLKNRRYIGELSFRDIVVPDAIPVIVPKDLFDRVQKPKPFSFAIVARVLLFGR